MTQRPTARVDFEEEGLIPNLKKRTENQKRDVLSGEITNHFLILRRITPQ